MSDQHPANEPLTVAGDLVNDDPEPLVVDYWRLTRALGTALDHDSPEFWHVVEALDVEFPGYSWHNAMTDGGPSAAPDSAAGLGLNPAAPIWAAFLAKARRRLWRDAWFRSGDDRVLVRGVMDRRMCWAAAAGDETYEWTTIRSQVLEPPRVRAAVAVVLEAGESVPSELLAEKLCADAEAVVAGCARAAGYPDGRPPPHATTTVVIFDSPPSTMAPPVSESRAGGLYYIASPQDPGTVAAPNAANKRWVSHRAMVAMAVCMPMATP